MNTSILLCPIHLVTCR
uniref:Uncharacterized protein n=1 Tax=Rhizophora mucronata TaxID=61149 RepID=A0A2P2NTT5_RHIMU